MASVAPTPFIARGCAFGPDKAACSGHPPSTARRPAGRAAASSAASFFTAACLLPALRHKHRPRCQRYASSGTSGPRVAVVGAGPAGLATALALRKEAGLQDVTVLERAPELRPGVGGGVQLHSGASLLEELGVDLSFAQPLRRIRSRSASGADLLQLDLPSLLDNFQPLSGSVRRADGQPASCTVMRDALLEAMAGALPDDSIRLSTKLLEVQTGAQGQSATCRFDSGQEEFDLVVAADGIGTRARSFVFGEEGQEEEPRYTGLRIQYGVREAGGRPAGCEEEVHQWFGQGVYALTATYGGIGGKRFEMMAVVFREEAPVAENADWDPAEIKDSCLERLRSAGQPEEVLQVAAGCERFFELGVFERPVGLNRWHRDRVVLLGDSAHAMPPFLGQGANQAIQDAVCLARWLRRVNFAKEASGGSLETALLGYTAQRLPPVAVLGIESGFLGQVETLPGDLGAMVRENFFRVTAGTGLAGLVFLNGAIARV
ncbi:ZEP [Symbiodinium pilosum]|uniref:ZEP protein n=1 Tax=Symbiodinium pilosum TaxID=2952 RepID=A0A812IQC8_SYMPI|nr:ZEP [Symbiodinium pilosum]